MPASASGRYQASTLTASPPIARIFSTLQLAMARDLRPPAVSSTRCSSSVMMSPQRAGSSREGHGILHLEARADRKDIGAVEDVTGARRVDDGNRIGGAPLQVAVLVPTHPFAAARDGHDTAIEPRELVQRRIVRRPG